MNKTKLNISKTLTIALALNTLIISTQCISADLGFQTLEQVIAIEIAANTWAQGNNHSYAGISNAILTPLMGNQSFMTSWGTQIMIESPTQTSYKIKIPKVPQSICDYLQHVLNSPNKTKLTKNLTSATSCNPSSPTDMLYKHTL